MTLVKTLLAHPELPHGEIRVCFTPDEEIGRGIAAAEELNAINEQVQERIDDAWRFAEAAPLPAPEEALTDVYVSYR